MNFNQEIYDEIYNKIIEYEVDEMDKYEFDDFDEFWMDYGNSENSLDLLSEGNKYYIDGIVNEWDKIIKLLYDCDLLDNIEPKDMTKRKITDLFLYQVCFEVIHNYVDELNGEALDNEE